MIQDAMGSPEDSLLPDATRREVIEGGLVLSTFAVTGVSITAPGEAAALESMNMLTARIRVNGKQHLLEFDPRTSLLDLLRERLALTGAKKGCDHGQCGACTVHVNDRRVLACMMPAVLADGQRVTTVEGLAPKDGALHPMQRAFVEHDALQCGYCTPGQIMSAIACVAEGHASSVEEIGEYMSGNLCRCGAYVGIVAAVRDAAGRMRGV